MSDLEKQQQEKKDEIDTQGEKLIYAIALEIFCISLIYTHYPMLDFKNKYLTPLITGTLTSLLGQSITQFCIWVKCNDNWSFLLSRLFPKISNDNSNSKSCNNGNGNDKDNNNDNDNNYRDKQSHLHVIERVISAEEHFKFGCWGALSGLCTSIWIDFLLTSFPERPLICVLLDQTIGNITMQIIYVVFVGIWDGNYNGWIHLIWKLTKVSYLIWPWVSVLSFTVLNSEWIFPFNCLVGTAFGVILGFHNN